MRNLAKSRPLNVEAVLFDLDGTLLDTAPDFITVLNQLLQEENKAPLAAATIREHVSDGSAALIALAFELTPEDERLPPLRQRLLALYEANLAVATRPFSGINDLLIHLAKAKIPWGIVTNKPSRYTKPLLEQLGLSSACTAVICPDDVSKTKPDPEALFKACEIIGCQAANSIYIGDHRRDIEAGKAAGMTTIAAGYGYINADDPIAQWQADYLVDSALEIRDLLITWS